MDGRATLRSRHGRFWRVGDFQLKPYTVDELLQAIWEDGPMNHDECDCNMCTAIELIVSYVN